MTTDPWTAYSEHVSEAESILAAHPQLDEANPAGAAMLHALLAIAYQLDLISNMVDEESGNGTN